MYDLYCCFHQAAHEAPPFLDAATSQWTSQTIGTRA